MHHVNDRTYSSELRFAAEAEAHRALWEQGFPTVEPLGYAFRSHGVGVEGLYLTGYEEAQPWPRVFDRTEKALPQFRMILGALSGWGLWAPDLNATNFILKPEGTLLALDWDRSRWQPPGAALHGAYLRRLMRSLRRLEAPEEIHGLIGSLA